MRKIAIILLCLFVTTPLIWAQKNCINDLTKGAEEFPELTYADIPGAPKLGKPMLITGKVKPVMSEGRGWASPAVFDWDNDGKKDLLIGEFISGEELENSPTLGSFIRVYRNTGTDSDPVFTGKFEYAYGAHSMNNGTPLSISLACCVSFRPQFIDLDNDGYKDIVAGHFLPGDVSWFRGSKNGFLDPVKLQQYGYPDSYIEGLSCSDPNQAYTDARNRWYWNYSSVNFGDFTGDGLDDMIVGGGALRISKNIGTKTQPRFGRRELLLDTNGKPLNIFKMTEEEIKSFENIIPLPPTGELGTVPLVTDWDQDGVLDLMVSDSYIKRGNNTVTFFRGVKTSEGHRFEPGIPLFSAKNGEKSFPGSWIQVFVTDWNNDGVNDLLIGTSVATLNGKFNYELSWSWEHETGIEKKNLGYFTDEYIKDMERRVEYSRKDSTYENADYLTNLYFGKAGIKNRTLIHKGFVYLMLGKKN